MSLTSLATNFRRTAVVVGGLGRSGTSAVKDFLADSPNAISFGRIEAKFFSERYGLVDLYRALVTDYRVEDASLALDNFKRLLTQQLTNSAYFGQPSILDAFGQNANRYSEIVNEFILALSIGPFAVALTEERFCELARTLVFEMIGLVDPGHATSRIFIEKTPHACLNPWIYQKIFSDVRFVWVMRDLRAVVYSLWKQKWGPSTLAECCQWVSITFNRFLETRRTVPALCITLEELSASPAANVPVVERFTGIKSSRSTTFFRADYADRWRKSITDEELEFIERLLRYDLAQYQDFLKMIKKSEAN